MVTTSALAATAALIADPARATMMQALMGGEALTAGELARAAGIAAPTASAHLARLAEGGLIVVHAQGRHRYHRIASDAVAATLEGLMGLAAIAAPRAPWRGDPALRAARTCWDHLAGRLGVALHVALQPHLHPVRGGWELDDMAGARLAAIGVDLARARQATHFCRDCMDWSERRPHLGGGLARGIAEACFARGWVRRGAGEGLARRCVRVSPEGARVLREVLRVAL